MLICDSGAMRILLEWRLLRLPVLRLVSGMFSFGVLPRMPWL